MEFPYTRIRFIDNKLAIKSNGLAFDVILGGGFGGLTAK